MKLKLIMLIISIVAYSNLFSNIVLRFEGRTPDEIEKLNKLIEPRIKNGSTFIHFLTGTAFNTLKILLDQKTYENIKANDDIEFTSHYRNKDIIGLVVRLGSESFGFAVKDGYKYTIRIKPSDLEECDISENNIENDAKNYCVYKEIASGYKAQKEKQTLSSQL